MNYSLLSPLRLLLAITTIAFCAAAATELSAQQNKAAADEKNNPYQIFVSTDGQKIEAEIMSVETPNVRIRRKDGQVFTFPISMLDNKSKEMVNAWALDQALSNSLEVRVRERTLKKEDASSNSSIGNILHNILQFTLTNSASVPVDNLRLEYRIFITEERIGRPGRDFAQEHVMSGSIDIGTLTAGQNKNFDSNIVKLLDERLRGNFVPATGNNRSSKDKISGYWYRLYRGKNLVSEEASPRRLMNVKQW